MLDRYVCTRVKSESPFDCVDPLDHAAATDSKANSDIAHSFDVCDMFQSRSLPQKKSVSDWCFAHGCFTSHGTIDSTMVIHTLIRLILANSKQRNEYIRMNKLKQHEAQKHNDLLCVVIKL